MKKAFKEGKVMVPDDILFLLPHQFNGELQQSRTSSALWRLCEF